LSNIEKPPN